MSLEVEQGAGSGVKDLFRIRDPSNLPIFVFRERIWDVRVKQVTDKAIET